MNYTMLCELFRKPKAKLDFITIGIPQSLMESNPLCREFHKAIRGRIELPVGRNKDWITIHDPLTSDLQWLLDNHPTAQILAIEIAIDFTLQDGSNNSEQLAALHGWFKTSLFPQRNATMDSVGKRKYYDARDGQIKLDTLRTKSGDETVYWTNPTAYEQVRLYIKKLDNKNPVKEHSVRIEATLFGGGCQNAGLYRVAELPQFADRLRRYLSKFLYVAKGIKPVLERRSRTNDPKMVAKAAHEAAKEQRRVERAWQQKGAAWAAKRDYATIPDADTNRLIGVALKSLRDDVRPLKLAAKVAEHPGYEVLKPPVNAGGRQSPKPLCIEGTLSLSQQDNDAANQTANEHDLAKKQENAPNNKDYPEKLGFQSGLGKSYAH